jgi:DnaD/phage-associated family protein
MKRDQFTFYRSYYEALKHLPKRDRADVLMAVIGYALDEEIPKLSGVPLSVFTLIRPTLDSGRNKAKNRLNKQKTSQEQTGTKQEQNGKEGESEREVEKELEREVESECEGEGENDSSLPTTPLPRSGPVAEVISDYLDRINPSASSASLDELRGYAEAMGAAVCKRAFDIALDSKKANWPYIRAILRDKQARGVRCLADWDALEAEHRTPAAGGRTDWAALAARMDAEEGTK